MSDLILDYFDSEYQNLLIIYGPIEAKFDKLINCLIEHIKSQNPLTLTDQGLFQNPQDMVVVVESPVIISPLVGSLCRDNSSVDNYLWRNGIGVWLDFIDLIRTVNDANFPCHQYLQSSISDEDIVIISKGEYI